MDFVHYEISVGASDIVEVTLDQQANVLLLDNSNFQLYRRRRRYQYHGGLVKQSPYRVSPPHGGTWHVVIDLGGARGTIRSACRVIDRRVA
jgi:hypothetical protein